MRCRKRQPHRQRGQQCQRRTAEAAAKGAGLIFFQRDSCQVAGRQHRPEQQRLRLDSQRHAEPDGGGQAAALFQQQKQSSSGSANAPSICFQTPVSNNSSGLNAVNAASTSAMCSPTLPRRAVV